MLLDKFSIGRHSGPFLSPGLIFPSFHPFPILSSPALSASSSHLRYATCLSSALSSLLFSPILPFLSSSPFLSFSPLLLFIFSVSTSSFPLLSPFLAFLFSPSLSTFHLTMYPFPSSLTMYPLGSSPLHPLLSYPFSSPALFFLLLLSPASLGQHHGLMQIITVSLTCILISIPPSLLLF